MFQSLNYRDKLNELAQEAYYYADQKNIKSNTNHNDKVDAFRHIYSSALTTYQYGDKLNKFLGNFYEFLHQNPSREKIMDFYNNEVGREIGNSLAKNIQNLKFNNEKEIKDYLAYEVELAVKNKKAITNLDDERIKIALENMPDHPFRVYTREEIDEMSLDEFKINRPNIFKNMIEKKIINRDEARQKVLNGDLIWVNGYTRKNGGQVKGYYRSSK